MKPTVPVYPAATLPYASLATTSTVNAVPAVKEPAAPNNSSDDAAAGTTWKEALAVSVPFPVSVTLSVRLVSVISDNLQHAGQAAFVRGIVERT